MAAKYQIFVSSTYEDLKDERDRVIQGILEMGHIPVGMEMFSAADDEQWKIIARHIDESDYYVVIVAHRYGSTVDGISYTRKEYEYALAKGLPVLGFVIDKSAPWPGNRTDTDAKAVRGLGDFKALVELKPVGYWTSAEDLYGKSSVALVKAFAASPRQGWVRSSSVLGPEVTAEISRLSSENASLRALLAEATQENVREQDLSAERDLATMRRQKRELSYRGRGDKVWTDGKSLSLGHIFDVLCPVMLVEATMKQIALLIAMSAAEEPSKVETIPLNTAGNILTDLMALDLVAPSTRKHSVADKEEYWSLTARGIEFAKRRARSRLEVADERVEEGAGAGLAEPVSEFERATGAP